MATLSIMTKLYPLVWETVPLLLATAQYVSPILHGIPTTFTLDHVCEMDLG